MNNKHICLIADGRSPTTVRWIQMLEKWGFKISLVSTYPMLDELDVDQTFILPVAFSNAGKSQNNPTITSPHKKLPFRKQLIQTGSRIGPNSSTDRGNSASQRAQCFIYAP